MYNDNPLIFTHDPDAFPIAVEGKPIPIFYFTDSPPAVVIAVNTFADDIERVVGTRPRVVAGDDDGEGIHVGIGIGKARERLRGRWECWDISVEGSSLIISGSDRRGVIYALYTLSAYMGVSPWYWWGDVPTTRQSDIYLVDTHLYHDEPIVKYRGFFLNDEQPVLWNWAYDQFKTSRNEPPFQVGMYEKVFELCLRLKGNYLWPAMWEAMFSVDGMDVKNGMPSKPTPGPNQDLAEKMGIVMGTSHHEPMGRNQKEYTDFGSGEWDYQKNGEWLRQFWEYGVERAKEGGCETVYTVGMRGDGDIELGGASRELLERIVADQQKILGRVLSDTPPQMWAMYKEVMGFFAKGLSVPKDGMLRPAMITYTVTPLLADDNWGNLMAVLPKAHEAGGGIYYHADYVGDPRSYKWINTVPLAKMWEQLNVAKAFKTTEIWILNVGDLKMLETPLELFLDIAYSDDIKRDSLIPWLTRRARRDYGSCSKEIAQITAEYSVLASRRKAELLDDKTYSLITFDEWEKVLSQWDELEKRALAVQAKLKPSRQLPFYEMTLIMIQLQTNLHHLYASVAKSNLYATQGRSSANVHAEKAMELFERDAKLTEEFNKKNNGKWRQIASSECSYNRGKPCYTRITVEDSLGAWPGDNRHNSVLGYNAPDPTLKPMDRYGRPRWVDIDSGGPEDVTFTVKPKEDWVKVNLSHGKVGPKDPDMRVWISIDWDKVDMKAKDGHVEISSSDGTSVMITLPLVHATTPPPSFKGSVEGDGYVVIEAANHTLRTGTTEHQWEEIPYCGRTQSGMGIFPVGDFKYDLGEGPSLKYDFWVTSDLSEEETTNGSQKSEINVQLHLGPALNYILGKRLAFGVQLDDGPIEQCEPVPASPAGELPHDWEDVVASEIREVDIKFPGERALGVGKHSVTVWGVTTGVVLQRVLIDLEGIRSRGETYFGPPESVRV